MNLGLDGKHFKKPIKITVNPTTQAVTMRQYNLPGLANVNVELTNRCNKRCWMCGRRKIERDYPELTLNYGDMEFSLVEAIAEQLPPNITVQLHDNGDPCHLLLV